MSSGGFYVYKNLTLYQVSSAMKEEPKIIGPDGEALPDETPTTKRSAAREQEEQHYMQVILKRSDEVLRHPDDVLEHVIHEGKEQLNRPAISLLFSAIAAGMILGFTVMAVAVVATALAPLGLDSLYRLGIAFAYPLGFVVCVMSRAQLFTEHTATAVYPILDNQLPVHYMFRLWGIVLVGNLLGAFAIANFLVAAEPVIQARDAYIGIAEHLVKQSFVPLFISAVLAGWLMALGGWLIYATPHGVSQLISIYIVTFIIGLGGLHHSIAGSVEIFTAHLFSNQFAYLDSLRFVCIAILGNLLGGSVFVALLNYAHIRHTQTHKER